jgi:hypothetical protein
MTGKKDINFKAPFRTFYRYTHHQLKKKSTKKEKEKLPPHYHKIPS